MTLAASIVVTLAANLTGSPDVGATVHTLSERIRAAFANGSGPNQATQLFADDFTITGAGSQTYDLAGGIANALGATLTFTAIKAILIINTGAALLTYGNGINPYLGFVGAAAHVIKIPAGGMLLLVDPTADGQAVVADTGDVIKLAGTDAAGTIIIIGEA